MSVFAAQMALVCCLGPGTPRVLDRIVRNVSVVAPRSLRNHMPKRQNKPGNSPRPGRGRPKPEHTRVVPEVTAVVWPLLLQVIMSNDSATKVSVVFRLIAACSRIGTFTGGGN